MGLEIERKFLIDLPDEQELIRRGAIIRSITQTYLLPNEDFPVRRVRASSVDGVATYTYTAKRPADGKFSREEIECEISHNQYLELQKERDLRLNQISKTRYVIKDKNVLEVDVFSFSKKRALLEIELASEDSMYFIPSYLKVIKEVTTDYRYTNVNLAKGIPEDF
ncbi:MAG: hypothetical protein J6V83_00860 [Clostridia bacterium]|nr:hypothetical protein [Clostridia bacterium]